MSKPASAVLATLAVLGVFAWFATAGPLTPPEGPVAPTMKTLDEISAQIAALSLSGGSGGGGVKRVVRGTTTYTKNANTVQTLTFSPAINPEKSVVQVNCCGTEYVNTNVPANARNAVCVLELTDTTLTVQVDKVLVTTPLLVSYQIIEYE
jgi:hypothetical protein